MMILCQYWYWFWMGFLHLPLYSSLVRLVIDWVQHLKRWLIPLLISLIGICFQMKWNECYQWLCLWLNNQSHWNALQVLDVPGKSLKMLVFNSNQSLLHCWLKLIIFSFRLFIAHIHISWYYVNLVIENSCSFQRLLKILGFAIISVVFMTITALTSMNNLKNIELCSFTSTWCMES